VTDEAPSPDEAAEKPAEPEAVASSAPAPEDAPAKKKKKKKKKAPVETDADAAVDPRGKAVAVAFDAGNFQRVRELSAELMKSDDPALQAIGRDYAARIAVDPIQIAFLGLCAVALLTIAWIYIPH
jgi:hypothetical protein